jgi:hypothetical protein
MAEIIISQEEADSLTKMPKARMDEQSYDFPIPGEKVSVNLQSTDGRERFILVVSRGKIEIKKATYQSRYHKIIILNRLDIVGPPHTNPDGSIVDCPHIHIYREGYGDKWAYPLPVTFSKTESLLKVLDEFMSYNNVTEPPMFSGGAI